jgi:hypothetical protein
MRCSLKLSINLDFRQKFYFVCRVTGNARTFLITQANEYWTLLTVDTLPWPLMLVFFFWTRSWFSYSCNLFVLDSKIDFAHHISISPWAHLSMKEGSLFCFVVMRSTELGWFLVKQHKAHTLQMKIWVEIARFVFYYQATPNFVTKSMVEINPPSIKQSRSKMKVFGRHTYGDWKKIQLPHDWRWNVLSRHKIGNGKVSVTTRLVTKKIHRHANCDWKNPITTRLAIEFWSLQNFVTIEKIIQRSIKFDCQFYDNFYFFGH